MVEECEVYIEFSVCGYYVYFKIILVCVGEVLKCEIEDNNEYDKYVIVVRNEEGRFFGYVFIEFLKCFNKLLWDFGEIEVECIGDCFNFGYGKGFEFLVDYRFIGNYWYLKRLIWRLKIKEFVENLNISDIRKCYDV